MSIYNSDMTSGLSNTGDIRDIGNARHIIDIERY